MLMPLASHSSPPGIAHSPDAGFAMVDGRVQRDAFFVRLSEERVMVRANRRRIGTNNGFPGNSGLMQLFPDGFPYHVGEGLPLRELA